MKTFFIALVVLATLQCAWAACPFGFSSKPAPVTTTMDDDVVARFGKALSQINWDNVKSDIIDLFTSSQDFWPADFGNYGPFFVRQTWHCTGSYRASDGLGGCDGARQRFNPELSWADNTNLDKAKTLLWPIKKKYGLGLSWGDLIVLTGTVAIESMGGPTLGFCAGRIDDDNGQWSKLLGPTKEQEEKFPCPVNGKCPIPPFGTTTDGLIYVNPEGPMGVPDPAASSGEVRLAFGSMGMNDTETVALIGGGHTFGKAHGACPLGPGPSPKEDPANPWPGMCPNGTFTSGFEGAWTPTPTKWSNSYFNSLVSKQFVKEIGPGGHYQWKPTDGSNIFMLTTDISLVNDPIYKPIVDGFASDFESFGSAFAHAWYKLVTRDMGPVTRCSGPWVPPAQPFQYPLPAPPQNPPSPSEVAGVIESVMTKANAALYPDNLPDGSAYYGAVFVHLAWQCAATFRVSDYIGGCNGARIRFPPQSQWSTNVAMDRALQVLDDVKAVYGDALTYSDLIVLAANVALTKSMSYLPAHQALNFCQGRSDATEGIPALYMTTEVGNYNVSHKDMIDEATRLALTIPQYIALQARLRSPGQMARLNLNGSYTKHIDRLSNDYFNVLLDNTWVPHINRQGDVYYTALKNPSLFATQLDMNVVQYPPFRAHARDFASDNNLFVSTFVLGWTRLMNADRFKGSTGNVCY